MEYSNDIQVIINSLSKEKKELSDRVNEIDKIIKRIKYGNMSFGGTKGKQPDNESDNIALSDTPKAFPLTQKCQTFLPFGGGIFLPLRTMNLQKTSTLPSLSCFF